jgi:hypothetical protein
MQRLREAAPDAAFAFRLYMGHFHFGVHEAIPAPTTYVTLIRDPVDRVLSLYQHRVEHHGVTAGIEEYLDRAFDIHVRDHQTRVLAGSDTDPRLGPCTEATLERAKRNIEDRFAFCGVTERFDEGLLLLARTFGWRDVRYVRHNDSTARRPRRGDLPERLIDRLEELNANDIALHRWATQRLVAQLSGWVELPAELVRFRRANQRFQRRGGKPALPVRAGRKLHRLLQAS